MLLSHSVGDFFTGIKILLKSIFQNHRRLQRDIVNILTHCSQKVRSEGVGSLMPLRNQMRYELLRDGISMIINDFTTDEIKHNLQAKISNKQASLQSASNLFENMSKVCPGVGMIGTLLGLIGMLANMEDPAKIGGGMALAMITTLYGLLLATILYAPWSEKIANESERLLDVDMLVMEGVLLLKQKKSSLHLKNIMNTYGNQAASQAPGQKR